MNLYHTINFGRYWEGTEMNALPIEWLILEEYEACYFAVSKQAIISKMFDEISGKWEESSIRNWLNNEFIELAFNSSERACLVSREIISKNDPYLTWGGKNTIPAIRAVKTIDRVFLLSTDEVEKFFKTKQSRIIEFSKYAIDTLMGEKDLMGIWWLRNEEELGCGPVRILSDGFYDGENNLGDGDPDKVVGIRPAIYIKKDCLGQRKNK